MDPLPSDDSDHNASDVDRSTKAGDLRASQAAEILGISERHAWRLLAAYRARGTASLEHGNSGRRPHNAVPADVASAVVRFATTRYPGANHTHLAELLWEQAPVPSGQVRMGRAVGPGAWCGRQCSRGRPRGVAGCAWGVRSGRMPVTRQRIPWSTDQCPLPGRGRVRMRRALGGVCSLTTSAWRLSRASTKEACAGGGARRCAWGVRSGRIPVRRQRIPRSTRAERPAKSGQVIMGRAVGSGRPVRAGRTRASQDRAG